MSKYLRTVRFKPYNKGNGPTFTLHLWRVDHPYYNMGYKLLMHLEGKTITLFHGEDFRLSSLYSPGDDDSVREIMSFLCLRPGDTDPDHFNQYTAIQLLFCRDYAENLLWECTCRFGED